MATELPSPQQLKSPTSPPAALMGMTSILPTFKLIDSMLFAVKAVWDGGQDSGGVAGPGIAGAGTSGAADRDHQSRNLNHIVSMPFSFPKQTCQTPASPTVPNGNSSTGDICGSLQPPGIFSCRDMKNKKNDLWGKRAVSG